VQKREAKREKLREQHMKLALLCTVKIFARVGALLLAIAGVDDNGLPDL
jgi:hypothetical protein